jgi:quinol-cytochrome oxidoreductase complex cytochrome b subunit
MVKKIFALFVFFIGLTIFISILNCQGSMNTITLPNGEVIWNLNGEWDTLIQPYGPWSLAPSYKQVTKITQEGSSFVGTRMIADKYNPIGSKSLQGELDKNGIKKVQILSNVLPEPWDAKGLISEDGNKIIIDDGVKVKVTSTRK